LGRLPSGRERRVTERASTLVSRGSAKGDEFTGGTWQPVPASGGRRGSGALPETAKEFVSKRKGPITGAATKIAIVSFPWLTGNDTPLVSDHTQSEAIAREITAAITWTSRPLCDNKCGISRCTREFFRVDPLDIGGIRDATPRKDRRRF